MSGGDDEREAEVSRLWREHLAEPWPPRLNAAERAGVDLLMLDADIAGCVHSWLASGGRLDPPRQQTLRRCLGELDLVVTELLPEDVPRRWLRLHRMARLVADDDRPESASQYRPTGPVL